MNYIKNISISFGVILGSILLFTLFITLLHYIGWINSKTLSIFEMLIPLISMLIGGIIIGMKSIKKGWLEGLKLAIFFLIFLVLFQYLGLKITFSIKLLLFYLLLSIACMLGSMIGINRKKVEN